MAKSLDPYRDRFDALRRRDQGFGGLTKPISPFGRGKQHATLVDVLQRERRYAASGAGVPRRPASAAELRQLFFKRYRAKQFQAMFLKRYGFKQQPSQGGGNVPATRRLRDSKEFAYKRVA